MSGTRRADTPFFTSHDGTRLAYKILGNLDSPSTLVFVNGLFCVDGYWVHLWRTLGPDHRLVCFDHRGHGHSDSPVDMERTTIQDAAQDIKALLDHLWIEKPVLFGFSLGVQILLEFWRLHPEQVKALVLINGPYENPLGTLYGLDIPPALWERLLPVLIQRVPRVTQGLWHAAFKLPWTHTVSTLVGGTRAKKSEMQHFYDHQQRVNVPVGLAMALAAVHHSAREILPTVRVPTLVIGGGKDTFAPGRLSETMHAEIPGSKYLFLPKGTHTTMLEYPEKICGAVLEFLGSVR